MKVNVDELWVKDFVSKKENLDMPKEWATVRFMKDKADVNDGIQTDDSCHVQRRVSSQKWHLNDTLREMTTRAIANPKFPHCSEKLNKINILNNIKSQVNYRQSLHTLKYGSEVALLLLLHTPLLMGTQLSYSHTAGIRQTSVFKCKRSVTTSLPP